MRFWFGGEPTPLRRERDEAIRSRFGGLLERAGTRASWPAGRTGRAGA